MQLICFVKEWDWRSVIKRKKKNFSDPVTMLMKVQTHPLMSPGMPQMDPPEEDSFPV